MNRYSISMSLRQNGQNTLRERSLERSGMSSRDHLLKALPKGTEVNAGSCMIAIDEFDLESDDEKREWIIKRLNAFANLLRPRLRKWYQESLRPGPILAKS